MGAPQDTLTVQILSLTPSSLRVVSDKMLACWAGAQVKER